MTVDEIVSRINPKRLAELRARYGDPVAPDRREKYLDARVYVRANLDRMKRLNLSPRSRVLDLGCGCGYFCRVLRHHGHEAVGLDIPERHGLYTDMRKLLGVDCITHEIRAYESLPPLGRFDAVTAHQVCFNGHNTAKLWGAHEWSWLLDQFDTPLVYIELNLERDGTLFPPGLREMFVGCGAQIDEHRVLIDRR